MEKDDLDKRLQESEKNFRFLIENIHDALYNVDTRGIFTYISPVITSILGYDASEIIGTQFGKFVFKEDLPVIMKKFIDIVTQVQKGFLNHEPLIDFRAITKDNQIKWLRSSQKPVLKNNKLEGFQGVLTDISEIKKAEEEKNRLLKAIEIAKEGICIASSKGHIIYTNNAMDELFGYKPGEMLNKDISILISPSSKLSLAQISQEIEKVGYWEGELNNEQKNSSEFISYAIFSALKNNEGAILNYIITQHDITERKKMQEALYRKEKLAIIGQLSSSIAHEIRNPISIINNVAYFLKLKLKDPDEKIKKQLQILEREIDRINRILSDVLEFTKMKKLQLEKTHINSSIKDTLDRIQIPSNIRLELELNPALPPISADPIKLQQVFENIITNAIQAMPDGGILTIKSLVTDQIIKIYFKDTGIGIPKDNLKKIFEPLFTTKPSGIGLGLAIVKEIIDAHNGTIEIESSIGKGTTFVINLPVTP